MHHSTKEIARNRIRVLFEQAEDPFTRRAALSESYAQFARRVAMSAKIRMSPQFQRRICKKCRSFLFYGENCHLRVKSKREPHIVITCHKCGWHQRIPFQKQKVAKRNE